MADAPPAGKVRIATPAIAFTLINCVWLLLLILGFYGYHNQYVFHPNAAWLNVASLLRPPADPIGGILPAYVPWAGALGGVTVSLLGCAKYSRDWDPKWNIWHALRPVLGAVAASIAFIILVLVLQTATSQNLTQVPTAPVPQALFFTIGFVAGFRDGLFLELVRKIAKMLLTTGEDDEDQVRPTFTVDPDELDFGSIQSNSSSQLPVRVNLTNPGATADLPAGWYAVTSSTDPPVFAATPVASNDLAARYRDIAVTFTPTATQPYEAELTISIGDIDKSVRLRGTGT